MDCGNEVAKAALAIKAITISAANPVTWASGFKMPIYNDNRKHLRFPANRNLITDGFVEIIRSEGIEADFVTGTSTAGIAPAASLAHRLQVPIGFTEDSGLFMMYTQQELSELASRVPEGRHDIIMSTCPTSIAPAVFIAIQRRLPFAYVRTKPKAHGLQQQIEGTLEKGERVLLLDFNNRNSYVGKAISAVEEKGGVVRDVISLDILDNYKTPQVRGKSGLHVEDLVSTGGSCIEEIAAWRNQGALIDHCIAIFSYGFGETMQRFAGANCILNPILEYDQLLSAAIETKDIKPGELEILKEWRTDYFGWGAKHGFPPVAKK